MKDFELENLTSEDETAALAYIGKDVRDKNIFQGNKRSKRKTDHSLPLNVEKQLTLF